MSMFKPHPYQEYTIQRIIAEPHVGLLLDMGRAWVKPYAR